MQLLSREKYDRWRAGAQVLEQDAWGEKVLHLADGTFLKLFRRKSWLSKTAFYPPAKRFADNADALQQLGIPCPEVLQLYRLTEPYRSAVQSHPLQAQTLRPLPHEQLAFDQRALAARLADS